MKNQLLDAVIDGLTPKKRKENNKMKEKQMLNGINAISIFCETSHVTLLEWRRDFSFPMQQTRESIWQADPAEIISWFRERRCTPKTASTARLERFEKLQRWAGKKGPKFNKKLIGTGEIKEFLGCDDLQVIEFMNFWVDCPIHRENGQIVSDADDLAAWAAKIELKTGNCPK